MPPIITEATILDLFVTAPPDALATYELRMNVLFRLMLVGFMGPAWAQQHVFGNPDEVVGPGKVYGFFELEFGDDIARETKVQRVLDLIEMLFNLQSAPGFYAFFQRFRQLPAQQFESAYAELQIAKMLFATGLDFRFVQARSVSKEDYDFELIFPNGQIACVEAKCRLEGEAINTTAIASKLGKARKQLPKNAPGIILFKVPHHWFSNHQMGHALRQVASDFLRKTTTVVSVKFYVSVVDLDPVAQTTNHRHAYDEIDNLRTKFAARNWNIFAGNKHRPNWKWLVSYAR